MVFSHCRAKNVRGTVIVIGVNPTLAMPIGALTSFILQLLYIADTSGAPEQR